jgi:hypothetical protein
VGAIDPVYGKSMDWNPGSNSFEGNQAMMVMPRGVVTGGDGNTQGRMNGGRIAVYDFNSMPSTVPNDSVIINPIEGRVEPSDEPFTVDGTATATSGVQRVEVMLRERDTKQYLQDNMTWGNASNTINATLASPGATSTAWSLSGLTIPDVRDERHQRGADGQAASADRDLRYRRPDAHDEHHRAEHQRDPDRDLHDHGRRLGRRRRELDPGVDP